MRCCAFVDGQQCQAEAVHGCQRVGGAYCAPCRERMAETGQWPHPPTPDPTRTVDGLRDRAGMPAREPVDRTPIRTVETPLEYRRRIWQVIGRACASGVPFTVDEVIRVGSTAPPGVDAHALVLDLLMHTQFQQHRVQVHPLDGTWCGL